MLNFKGIDNSGYGGYDLTDQVLMNLKFWIDWGLLNHGAYGIYRLDDASFYNDTEDRLIPVYDERFGSGRVWTGVGQEWVWESGVIAQSGFEPFRVSGVYINGDFNPAGTVGPYSFHIDYQHGRVIFDNCMSPQDDIRAEYCHKMVNVAFSDHPNFRKLMQDAVVTQITNSVGSGTPARENQAYLPSIFIDYRGGGQRGLELGGGQIKERLIVLHIFADNSSDRNLLADWLDKQSRSAFVMTDINSFVVPFDEYGDIVSGITNWPDMIGQFPGKKIRIMDGNVRRIDSINPNIYRARVEWDVEIDIGGI